MKKILLILVLLILFIPSVKADTLTITSADYTTIIKNKDALELKAQLLVDYFNQSLSQEYKYYIIYYYNEIEIGENLYLYPFNKIITPNGISYDSEKDLYYYFFGGINSYILAYANLETLEVTTQSLGRQINYHVFEFDPNFTKFTNFRFIYDSNYNFIYKTNIIKDSLPDYNIDEIIISGFYNNSNIIINAQDRIPTMRELLKYSSYEDYISNKLGLIEVNLDNYEYVILNLKDYSKIEAFDVGLKVKGMIGITPVYEFGTVEKDVNSGDRCNISYSDYTDYRLYILKNDLINNAVYYVKGCQDNSSFKFDSSIFDITYVTADNVNDPVITVGGVDYHTIPLKELSWSANSNEENNVIPGESEQFDPVGGVVSYISNFWNSLTTLMSLVTKFFNTLPIEIRAISITMFTTAITLGVIKFLKS